MKKQHTNATTLLQPSQNETTATTRSTRTKTRDQKVARSAIPSQDVKAQSTRVVAYHEAGQAVLQVVLNPGEELISASIIPDPDSNSEGRIVVKPMHPVARDLAGIPYDGTVGRDKFICHETIVHLAGEISERLFCSDTIPPHLSGRDHRSAEALLRHWDRGALQFELEEKLRELHSHAVELLKTPAIAASIRAVAAALSEHGELAGSLVRALVDAEFTKLSSPKKICCPHCQSSQRLYELWSDQNW